MTVEQFPVLQSVAVLTTAQRNALVGGALYDGHVIYNSTTMQLEQYSSATSSWVAAGAVVYYPRFLTGS